MADTVEDLSKALDLISQEPGAIIYRGDDIWEALEPGNMGDVLVLDENLKPAWVDPATVNFPS